MKFLLLLLFSASAFANTVFQSPIHEAKWQTEASPLSCTLTHDVLDYGQVRFQRLSGESVKLVINSQDHPASLSPVEVVVTNTPWQIEAINQKLLTLPVNSGQREFIIDGNAASQALSALQQGQFVQLHYASPNSPHPVSVVVSSVQFLPAMREFQICSDQMHPDSFADLQYFNVYFESEKAILDNKAAGQMQRLADYLKVDNSITRIIIESHTDSFGRRELNTELSEQRADVVRNFLIQQAEVQEDIIETHSYRDAKPAASNRTSAGRAQNRRAEIRLIR